MSDKDDEEEGDAEYEVSRILKRRGQGITKEYLVQWEDETAKWKRVGELENCADTVKTYDRYVEENPDRIAPNTEFMARYLPSV